MKALTQLFTLPSLKTTGVAMASGFAAGKLYDAAVEHLEFVTTPWRRFGVAAALAVGAGLLRSKSATAAAGAQGVLGYLGGQELYTAITDKIPNAPAAGVGNYVQRMQRAAQLHGAAVQQIGAASVSQVGSVGSRPAVRLNDGRW